MIKQTKVGDDLLMLLSLLQQLHFGVLQLALQLGLA